MNLIEPVKVHGIIVGYKWKLTFSGGITMEEEIKKAITLLKNNGYFVTKIPKNLCDNAKECSETGHGECTDCSCFACIIGCDF